MSSVGTVYGQALYELAREEALDTRVLEQLSVLDDCFRREPEYIRLLCAANLSKQERCGILDEAFRGKVEPCVLNFMKLLTEKGCMRRFSECCKAYGALYNEAHGILEVKAVTAVALTESQTERLAQKLSAITGKTVKLCNKVDSSVLGGVRLDYHGVRVDDTVSHRLDDMAKRLANTVL